MITASERAAKPAFDTLGHLRKSGLTVERRKNGAADESRAAQARQDGAAEPLHGDAAAIDDGGFGSVRRKRWFMTEVDEARFASFMSSACRTQIRRPPNPATVTFLRAAASGVPGRRRKIRVSDAQGA